MTSDRYFSTLLGVIGALLLLLMWQIVGHFRLLGMSFPALTEVLGYLLDPSRAGLFKRAVYATSVSFVIGFFFGALLAFLSATLAHMYPLLRTINDRLNAVVHSVPAIALAPIFIVTAGREWTPVALAALGVYFILYVATTSGLAASSPAHRDVLRALGAGRIERWRLLEVPAALPAVFSGLKLATPAALIGVILGEWFGAPGGLGLLILSAMQNFQIPLLWSAVILILLLSSIIFGILSMGERVIHARFRA